MNRDGEVPKFAEDGGIGDVLCRDGRRFVGDVLCLEAPVGDNGLDDCGSGDVLCLEVGGGGYLYGGGVIVLQVAYGFGSEPGVALDGLAGSLHL